MSRIRATFRRVAVAVSAVPLALPASPAQATMTPFVQSEWAGIVTFGDCGTSVCIGGDSTVCHDTVSVAARQVTVTGCGATVAATYAKAKAGTQYVCAGAGSGTITFRDVTGTSISVDVVAVASEGKVVLDGRYVDAFGHSVYAVHAVVTPACGSIGAWSGTMTAYDY